MQATIDQLETRQNTLMRRIKREIHRTRKSRLRLQKMLRADSYSNTPTLDSEIDENSAKNAFENQGSSKIYLSSDLEISKNSSKNSSKYSLKYKMVFINMSQKWLKTTFLKLDTLTLKWPINALLTLKSPF